MNWKSAFCLILFLFAYKVLNGQKFKDVTTFACEGYALEKIGYPSRLVSDHKGNFYFVEFWVQGKGGRRLSGKYLQAFNSQMEELWFKPLFSETQSQSYQFIDLIPLNKSLAAIGSLPIDKKQRKTIVQFFDYKGKELSPQIQLSNFDIFKADESEFSQQIIFSNDSSLFLWMGYNPQQSANKRRTFLAVFGSDTKKLWSNELNIPFTDKKYIIKQVLLDKKGNAYFLMIYEKYFNNLDEDKKNLPVIVKYDYKQKKFFEYPVAFENASVPEIQLFLTSDNFLYALGVLANDKKAFQNGDKIYDKPIYWSQIFLKRFNIWEGMNQDIDKTFDFPEEIVKQYAQNPANFKEHFLVEKNERLLWLMEEAFQQSKDGGKMFFRNNIAIFSFSLQQNYIEWATQIEKKQRDFNNDQLFSYTYHFTKDRMHLVYLSEKGANGKGINVGIDLKDGSKIQQELFKNENSAFYFFPARGTSIDEKTLILLGTGRPNANEYMLLRVVYF